MSSINFGVKSREFIDNCGERYVGKGERIYKRDGIRYRPIALEDLCRKIRSYSHDNENFLPNTRTTTVRDVASHVLARIHQESLEEGVFIGEKKVEDKTYSLMDNGILEINFNGREVIVRSLPHSENFFSLYALPYKYNPEARCPKFEKFINEIMSPDQVLLFQQWLGYCLVPITRMDKIMMVLGAGGNGKGVLFLITKLVLGEENISHFPLEELFIDNFAMAELEGKLLNLSEEMENGTYIPVGKLKAFTGGAAVYVNQKHVKRHIMQPITRLMNSGNGYPDLEDNSDAMLRRLLIIELKKQFLGKEGNSDLRKKDYWQDELSGIFNWAIEGLKSLVANGDKGWEFSVSDSIYEKIKSYDRSSSPLKSFFDDNLVEDSEAYEWSGDIYELYKKFCQDYRFKIINHSNFSKALLKHYYPRVVESPNALRRKGHTKRDRVFYGIKFKLDEPVENPSMVHPLPSTEENPLAQMAQDISPANDISDSER